MLLHISQSCNISQGQVHPAPKHVLSWSKLQACQNSELDQRENKFGGPKNYLGLCSKEKNSCSNHEFSPVTLLFLWSSPCIVEVSFFSTNSLSGSSTTNTKSPVLDTNLCQWPTCHPHAGLTHYQNHGQHLNTAMNQCTSILIMLLPPSIPKNFLFNNLSKKLYMLFSFSNTHTHLYMT